MNNLLKIFLIFNLVSSAASSVNNFSVPLPERELKVGQNSSEVIEGENSFFETVNSSTPQGTPMGGKSSTVNIQARQPGKFVLRGGDFINLRIPPGVRNSNLPRACTLGWAVKRTKGYPKFPYGYLTSGACNPSSARRLTLDAFVYNNEGEIVVVGKVSAGNSYYYPQQGYDYAVIKIFADYWDPKTSMGTWFHFNPPTLIPTLDPQNVAAGWRVCFFGAQSQHVCGKVVNMDVVSEELNPWPNRVGYHIHENFNHLVMVRIENDHITRAQSIGRPSDDKGAPVYAPRLQDGFLTGAHPVGLFHTYAISPLEFLGLELPIPQDIPYFYYVRLDNILDVEGLELITTPKQKQPTEVELSSLATPSLMTKISSNSSMAVASERSELSYTAVGLAVIGITIERDVTAQRPCTFAFPMKDNEGMGYLTPASCVAGDVFVADDKIGTVIYAGFNADLGIDWSFVKIDEPSQYWHPLYSKTLPISWFDGHGKYIDIKYLSMNIPTQPPLGDLVCAYGGVSNLVCGKIIEFNVTVWSWNPGIPPSKSTGLTLLKETTKVLMNKIRDRGDAGAPVFIIDVIPFSTPTSLLANPVGMVIDDQEESSTSTPYWYYIPVDRILEDFKKQDNSSTLITIDPEKNE